MAGVCGAITNAPDATKCGDASNACHTNRLCKAGACQAEGTHPDGYNYDSGNYLARCCGGAPTSINTPNNCGACGLKCASGRCDQPGRDQQSTVVVLVHRQLRVLVRLLRRRLASGLLTEQLRFDRPLHRLPGGRQLHRLPDTALLVSLLMTRS